MAVPSKLLQIISIMKVLVRSEFYGTFTVRFRKGALESWKKEETGHFLESRIENKSKKELEK